MLRRTSFGREEGGRLFSLLGSGRVGEYFEVLEFLLIFSNPGSGVAEKYGSTGVEPLINGLVANAVNAAMLEKHEKRFEVKGAAGLKILYFVVVVQFGRA